MTIETEDALRAALHRARSWIATDPAVDDDPYSILIEVDCALALPVDDEAKRIRAAIDDFAEDVRYRMQAVDVKLGVLGALDKCVTDAKRALAQPEQGGAT